LEQTRRKPSTVASSRTRMGLRTSNPRGANRPAGVGRRSRAPWRPPLGDGR